MKRNSKAIIILVVLSAAIIVGSAFLYQNGSSTGTPDAVSHSTSK